MADDLYQTMLQEQAKEEATAGLTPIPNQAKAPDDSTQGWTNNGNIQYNMQEEISAAPIAQQEHLRQFWDETKQRFSAVKLLFGTQPYGSFQPAFAVADGKGLPDYSNDDAASHIVTYTKQSGRNGRFRDSFGKKENGTTDITGNPKEVNIHGKINTELDEVDLINKIIFEDKNASKLYMDNPDFPQTALQWAEKQIFKKGKNRIEALRQAEFNLSSKASSVLPSVEELKGIKNYVFRIDADTPELRNAVQIQLDKLSKLFPEYHFSTIYGGKENGY